MPTRRKRKDLDPTRSDESRASTALPGRRPIVGLAAAIVLATAATYANNLSGPFVLDDSLTVVENRQLQEWWRVAGVLFAERDTSIAGRPLASLSFAINYAIGGLDVRGYHLVNIAIHLAASLVLFGVVGRTLELPSLTPSRVGRRSVWIAFAVALIWALHPLNSEVVNYLTQRTESMMGLFYLLTLYASIRALEPSHRTAWQTAAIGSCVLGMACKESMVTAPIMIVLFDRIFVFTSMKQALRERAPFYAGLMATWLVLAGLIATEPRGQSAGFSNDVSPWTYLLNQTMMITRYLYLTVWPRPLVAWYGWALPLTLADVVPYAVFVVLLLVLTVAALLTRPWVGFLGAWFFITLAPTSTIVPIATEMGAERRMYLPLAALVVLMVVLTSLVWDRIGRARADAPRVAISAVVLVAGLLAAGTVVRNREYRSSLILARTMVERWPSSATRHLFGTELIAAGLTEEGIAQLRAAAPTAPRARLDLGRQLFNEGRLDEAIEQLEGMLDIWQTPPLTHPHWQQPLRIDAMAARTLIGQASARSGRWPEAIEQYRLALAIEPAYVPARRLLADALWQQMNYEEAAAAYERYLELRPNDTSALTNMGIALVELGRLDAAIGAFRRAVDTNPADADAHRNLATALFDRRDADGASEHARLAVTLKPDVAASHDLLGRVLTMQGRLDEAKAQFERALAIDPGFEDAREALKRLAQIAPTTRE